MPDTEEQIAKGNFAPVTTWLGERIHKHGAKFTAPEIAERAVGAELSPEPFMRFLKEKYGKIYGL